jgi:hypothetical protein
MFESCLFKNCIFLFSSKEISKTWLSLSKKKKRAVEIYEKRAKKKNFFPVQFFPIFTKNPREKKIIFSFLL